MEGFCQQIKNKNHYLQFFDCDKKELSRENGTARNFYQILSSISRIFLFTPSIFFL